VPCNLWPWPMALAHGFEDDMGGGVWGTWAIVVPATALRGAMICPSLALQRLLARPARRGTWWNNETYWRRRDSPPSVPLSSQASAFTLVCPRADGDSVWNVPFLMTLGPWGMSTSPGADPQSKTTTVSGKRKGEAEYKAAPESQINSELGVRAAVTREEEARQLVAQTKRRSVEYLTVKRRRS